MRIGLSEPATASLSAFANGSTGMATGGTKTAMTASTSNDAKASRTAVANSFRTRLGAEVDRVADLQTFTAGRVRSKDTERGRVADDRKPGAGGQRLVSEEQGAVEQL